MSSSECLQKRLSGKTANLSLEVESNSNNPYNHIAILQTTERDRVRCGLCERRCLISKRGKGWCQTRQNRGGRLFTLIYGAVSSLSDNPIEKKPFYHFHPGTRALTVGSWSCNFSCPWCQNWDISKQAPPQPGTSALQSRYLSPAHFVELAMQSGCQGTSLSFNEPTLSFEWALDVFPLARQYGLYNTYVTNGYMTPTALDMLISAGLDAMNVDIKGDADMIRRHCQGIDIEKVWATCQSALQCGIHLEVTTLVIPTVNDSPDILRGIAERITSQLSPHVPWHVSGYYPAYHFEAHPTPQDTLEQAWQIGKQAGIEYIYIGNLPGHPLANTRCPSCQTMLIHRNGFNVLANNLQNGRCPTCAQPVAGVW